MLQLVSGASAAAGPGFGIDDTPSGAGVKAKAVGKLLFSSFRYYIS
jgi:hypothetical protein